MAETAGPVVAELPSARHVAKGLAALRIFVGSIFLANGLAKRFGTTTITVGPYTANLIDREATRFILHYEGLVNPANGGPGPRSRPWARSRRGSHAPILEQRRQPGESDRRPAGSSTRPLPVRGSSPGSSGSAPFGPSWTPAT